jgi:carbamoyl-phosphate synthase large subunit
VVNVLVTGAGGGVGQGIIKSIKMIGDLDIHIVAADMSEKSSGLYAGDVARLVDACKSDAYLETLGKIFVKDSIDYYFPGTDVELKFCAKYKSLILENYGVKTVISSLTAVEISDDKFKTYLFLKNNGFSYPKTVWLNEFLQAEEMAFPVIVKPAIGCGSIGVYKVRNEDELSIHLNNFDGKVAQELIGDDESEYTCTIVKVNNKVSPVLALKRILRSGDTYRAEPINSQIIQNYVHEVACALEIDGACNFQLRLDSTGIPKIFEINCRFSGTTPFCSQLGFNPVEFYLKHDLSIDYIPTIDYSSIVLRYWMEVVVPKETLEELKINKVKKPNLKNQFNLF